MEEGSGANLWIEWAKLEVAQVRGEMYAPPVPHQEYAGLLVSLTRQEWPDTSSFDDPELVWRLHKHHHVGLIVCSTDYFH